MIQNGIILKQAVDGVSKVVMTDTVKQSDGYVAQLRFYDANGKLFYTLQLSATARMSLTPTIPSVLLPPPSAPPEFRVS